MTNYPVTWKPAPQTIYIGLAEIRGDGLFHVVDCSVPANADTPAKQMAYVADTALGISDGRPFKVHALTIVAGLPEQCVDVTAEAVTSLVDCLRNPPSPMLLLDAVLGYLPFWMDAYDPSLTMQEMDANADAEAV